MDSSIMVSHRSRRWMAGLLAPALAFSALVGVNLVTHTADASTETVVAWGENDFGQSDVPAGLTGVTAIAAGSSHSLALKADGTVVSWGSISDSPAGLTGVTAIAAGSNHNLAVTDGTVVAWGENYDNQLNVPAGLTGVTAVAGGGGHSLALKDDGTVVGWGADDCGQASVPMTWSNVVAISAAQHGSIGLLGDGTVVGDGGCDAGVIPDGLTNVVAIASSPDGYSGMALKNDGTVQVWGTNTAVPNGLSGVTAIATSDRTWYALLEDGTIEAWGRLQGQCFPWQDPCTPATYSPPAGLSGITAIAAGGSFSSHALAIQSVPGISQSITFGQLSNRLTSPSTFAVSAVSDSDLVVSFDSTTKGICTVSGTTVTLLGGTGTCTVRASQAGDSTYDAATPVDRSFQVTDAATAFGIADSGAYEGSGPRGTTVSAMYGFDRPTNEALCIWYETQIDASAIGVDKISAHDGSQDFTRLGVSKPKFVILPSGRTSGKISTKINYDTTPEGDEHYNVVVTKVTTQVGGKCVSSTTADPRVVLRRTTSRVTIFDDDTPVAKN